MFAALKLFIKITKTGLKQSKKIKKIPALHFFKKLLKLGFFKAVDSQP